MLNYSAFNDMQQTQQAYRRTQRTVKNTIKYGMCQNIKFAVNRK